MDNLAECEQSFKHSSLISKTKVLNYLHLSKAPGLIHWASKPTMAIQMMKPMHEMSLGFLSQVLRIIEIIFMVLFTFWNDWKRV